MAWHAIPERPGDQPLHPITRTTKAYTAFDWFAGFCVPASRRIPTFPPGVHDAWMTFSLVAASDEAGIQPATFIRLYRSAATNLQRNRVSCCKLATLSPTIASLVCLRSSRRAGLGRARCRQLLTVREERQMRDGQARDNHPSTQFRSPDGYEHLSGRLKYQMLMLLGPNPVRVVRFGPVQYHRHGRPGELLSVHLDTGLHNDPTIRDHSCSLLSLGLLVNVTSAWVATRGILPHQFPLQASEQSMLSQLVGNKPSGSEFVYLRSAASAFLTSGLEGKNCVNSCRAPVSLADQVFLVDGRNALYLLEPMRRFQY